jgi:hypothetical protein
MKLKRISLVAGSIRGASAPRARPHPELPGFHIRCVSSLAAQDLVTLVRSFVKLHFHYYVPVAMAAGRVVKNMTAKHIVSSRA